MKADTINSFPHTAVSNRNRSKASLQPQRTVHIIFVRIFSLFLDILYDVKNVKNVMVQGDSELPFPGPKRDMLMEN